MAHWQLGPVDKAPIAPSLPAAAGQQEEQRATRERRPQHTPATRGVKKRRRAARRTSTRCREPATGIQMPSPASLPGRRSAARRAGARCGGAGDFFIFYAKSPRCYKGATSSGRTSGHAPKFLRRSATFSGSGFFASTGHLPS
jgi:hypothetical protein